MLIVWDYFGVVAEDAFWYEAQKIAAKNGTGHDLTVASRAVNTGIITWDEFCSEVAEDTGLSLGDVKERYEQHNINKEVVLAIKKYKKHAKHVLLSNAAHTHLLPLMSRLGLNALFDDIFVSSLIGHAKPDPRCFNYVLRAMDTYAGDAVLIDDMARNCDSAEDLGMKAVVYTRDLDLGAVLGKLI